MRLTRDEQRALAFVATLLFASAAVRAATLPEPVDPPGDGGFDLAAHIEATEQAVAAAERRERPLAEGETVDPNTASVDELVRLPGVGPALARRITDHRAEHGRFRTAGDLGRVAGIGERTLERLRPHLALPAGPASGVGAGAVGRSPAPRRGPVALPRPAPATSDAGAGSSGGRAGRPVDLNAADAGALTALPGIGPVLAARIVAYRDSAGPFRRIEDLEAVPGIGPATVARIGDRATVR